VAEFTSPSVDIVGWIRSNGRAFTSVETLARCRRETNDVPYRRRRRLEDHYRSGQTPILSRRRSRCVSWRDRNVSTIAMA